MYFHANQGLINWIPKTLFSGMLSPIDDPNKGRVDNDNFKYNKVNFTYDSKTGSVLFLRANYNNFE
jgi:hypothetical protein